MTEKEKAQKELIQLLMCERDCLRSVLSEWDSDKSCYVQWDCAEDLSRAIENLYTLVR